MDVKNLSPGFVYTPKLKIPIGEAVVHEDGTHALRVKNPRTNKTDEISLDCLFAEVVQAAERQRP